MRALARPECLSVSSSANVAGVLTLSACQSLGILPLLSSKPPLGGNFVESAAALAIETNNVSMTAAIGRLIFCMMFLRMAQGRLYERAIVPTRYSAIGPA